MNKLLVTLYVPLLDEKYDIYIPINKKIGTIKKIVIDIVNELSGNSLTNTDKMKLYDKENCKPYDNNVYVKSSNIVNGSILMLI